MLAPQARAAHWEMTYRPDGVTTAANGDYSNDWSNGIERYPSYNAGFISFTNSSPGSPLYRPLAQDSGPRYYGSSSSYKATSAFTGGSLTFRFKWVQDGPTQDNPNGDHIPPPKMVVLNIWGSAFARADSPTSQSAVKSAFGKVAETETSYADLYRHYRFSNADVPEQSPLRIPLVVAPGAEDVEYTLSLSAKAITNFIEVTANPNYTAPSSTASLAVYVQRTDLGVAITSDIETSWKKWTGDVSALPTAYKKRSSTGTLLNEPNDKAVLVAPNSTDSSKNIWKIQCLRDADGGITVHSAPVRIVYAAPGSSPSYLWLARPMGSQHLGFHANHVGILTPQHTWSLAGGTMHQTAPIQTGDEYLIPTKVHSVEESVNQGLKLGSTASGSDLVRTTTVDLSTTDTHPSSSSIPVVAAPYTVNWHLPVGNWKPNGVTPAGTKSLQGRTSLPNGGTSTGPNGPLLYSYEDLIDIEYPSDDSDALSTASASILTGAAGATVIYGFMGAVPPAAPLAIATLLGETLGLTSSVTGGTYQPTPRELPTNYARYKADLQLQRSQGGYDNGTKSFDGRDTVLNELIDNFKQDSDEASDTYFSQTQQGHISVSGVAIRIKTKKSYVGDRYNRNGYVGPAPANIFDYSGPIPQMTWTFSAITPGGGNG